MKVMPLPQNGNSSKFEVTISRGTFVLTLSHTLRTRIWQLQDANAELSAATQIAEALIGRHDPKLPFREVYVFGEHNTQPTLEATVKYLHKNLV